MNEDTSTQQNVRPGPVPGGPVSVEGGLLRWYSENMSKYLGLVMPPHTWTANVDGTYTHTFAASGWQYEQEAQEWLAVQQDQAANASPLWSNLIYHPPKTPSVMHACTPDEPARLLAAYEPDCGIYPDKSGNVRIMCLRCKQSLEVSGNENKEGTK